MGSRFISMFLLLMYAIIHDEMLQALDHLEPELQGRILLAFVRYQLDGSIPSKDDVIVYSVFMMKKFDLDSMVSRAKASRTNGQRGGAPSGNQNAVKSWDIVSKQPRNNLEQPRDNLEQPRTTMNSKQLTVNSNQLTVNSEQLTNTENKKSKYADFVFLSEDEHSRLINKLGLKRTTDLIDQLNNYIGQRGVARANKNYKSHYFTILSWARREGGSNTSSYAYEQALERQRSQVREQIGSLSPNESNDADSSKGNEEADSLER